MNVNYSQLKCHASLRMRLCLMDSKHYISVEIEYDKQNLDR